MLLSMNLYAFIFRLMVGFLVIPHCVHGEAGTEDELFRQQCAVLAQNAEKENAMAVAGNDGWLFLSSELRHLGVGRFWGEAAPGVSRATGPEAADPLPAILDFNGQLKKIGVELIIVPVPPKAVIYPDMLPGYTKKNSTTRLDRFHQEFYALLQSKGVKVLDLTDFFIQNKNNSQGPLYCRQDSHWSGNGCVLAAEKIAAAARPILGDGGRKTNAYQYEWQTIEINGDLRQTLNGKNIPREKLRIRKIVKSGSDEPVEPDAESKIILLGDSHNLVFHAGEDMLCSGAGLPDQLAFELGFPVELVAVRGSGATPARVNLMRRARQKNDYWKNKKCAIWCFAAREFTESDGWRKAPMPALNQNTKKKQMNESEVKEITAISSIDSSAEQSLFYFPPGKTNAVPLVVGLHTWSCERTNQLAALLPLCQKRGWALLLPEFRGPNLTGNPRAKQACASRLAKQDIIDALDWVIKNNSIDEKNIFLVGGSGGGHMALMMAAYAPFRFRAVSSWCPITDLAAWHGQNAGYSAHIEACCGGKPGASPAIDHEYSARSPLFQVAAMTNANLSVHHGRFDTSVPYSHTMNLAAELEKLGAKNLFFEIFDGGHEIRSDVAFQWFDKLAKPDANSEKKLTR